MLTATETVVTMPVCCLLGLEENIGIMNYHVDTSRSPSTAISQWQNKVVELRRNLRAHSIHLLYDEVYPADTRNFEDDMWYLSSCITNDEVDGTENRYGLSDCFAPEHVKPAEYFSYRFRSFTDPHMNPYWVTLVLASLMRIRVIVYVQNVVSREEHEWSMIVSCLGIQ
jgi:hypothetical protein